MLWRSFLYVVQKASNTRFMKLNKQMKELEKSITFLKSFSMDPVRKMKKFLPEECEMIINVNRKGACTFDIVSKVETVCDDPTANLSSASGGKHIQSGQEVVKFVDSSDCHETERCGNSCTSGIDSTGKKQSEPDNEQGIADIAAQIPPTSQCVALDCEFVGVLRDISALGRCSIVNYEGEVICDIYARPVETITTYRTKWSGITKAHMQKAIPLESALSQISDILQDKVVIGHGIHHDFSVLGISHPEHLTRDTQKSKHLLAKMRKDHDVKNFVALKRMTLHLLGKHIQIGQHCSIQDATASMELYKLVREEWETSLLKNGNRPTKNDSDQASGNTDEAMDTSTSVDNSGQEHPSNMNKMAVPGKVAKRKRRKKKCHGLNGQFGQIIGGNKNIQDYFKEDKNILKQGKEKVSDFLRLKISTEVKNGENSHNHVSVSNKVKEPVSDIHVDTCNSATICLRDGKTYPNEVKNVGECQSKRKTSNKFQLKTQYAETIKQLFHDQFWEDAPNTDPSS